MKRVMSEAPFRDVDFTQGRELTMRRIVLTSRVLLALVIGAVAVSLAKPAAPAEAAEALPSPNVYGEVVQKASHCDYFVVADQSGDYSVLEWYGGSEPDRGDMLAGDWNRYGMIDVQNVSSGTSIHAWVEDYMLSRSRAADVFARKCH